MDKSQSSPGVRHGGGSRNTVCLHLQWTQLALCPCTAIRGLQPYTPSQRQAFRHSAPGKGRGEPYGQISQPEVCQLLSAGPQVIYPVGLNGNDKPVMTTLPEPLHSSASVTTNEHPYMRINIPPPPLEEPEHATLLVGKVHTIPAVNSPKPPQSQESA